MRILVYNPNSSGGNYEYILQLTKYFQEKSQVTVLLPKNAEIGSSSIYWKKLLSDKPKFTASFFSRSYFFWRSLINPLRLLSSIRHNKPTWVLFNDYDQLTSFIWAPLFKILTKGSKYAVILHDPDRDAYFTSSKISEWSMKLFMSIIKISFYHTYLPSKKYYDSSFVKFVSIPHGIYPVNENECDSKLKEEIDAFKNQEYIFGILGNVRIEKNYEIAIKALSKAKGRLLIAGRASSSNVDVNRLKKIVLDLGMQNKVMWVDKYLTQQELNTLIKACDVVVLYYKKSFSSQSGILNQIAPFCKKVIVSETDSALTALVRKFEIGYLVKPDDTSALAAAFNEIYNHPHNEAGWKSYLNYASWKNASDIILNCFKSEG